MYYYLVIECDFDPLFSCFCGFDLLVRLLVASQFTKKHALHQFASEREFEHSINK